MTTYALDIRVIATPEDTAQAVALLRGVFRNVQRRRGPYPSDKDPGKVLLYLDADLPLPATATTGSPTPAAASAASTTAPPPGMPLEIPEAEGGGCA